MMGETKMERKRRRSRGNRKKLGPEWAILNHMADQLSDEIRKVVCGRQLLIGESCFTRESGKHTSLDIVQRMVRGCPDCTRLCELVARRKAMFNRMNEIRRNHSRQHAA